MTGAVFAALLSALCFALGAALQQREALRATDFGVADPRLLWRLAHRPIWLAGIVADGLSAALHILALSLGPIALVQPLGVTGLLFAIPMVAVLRRQRIRRADVAAAVAVLAGLVALLQLVPATVDTRVSGASVIAAVAVGTLALAAAGAAVAQFKPGRPRALLLAAGAGASFGITAVLVRALLETAGSHSVPTIVTAVVAIGLLIPTGYLLLQSSYRAGHFAASLATAVVVDPVSAMLGGVPVLSERLPQTLGQVFTAVISAGVIIAGIVMLVRSPAELFTPLEPKPPAKDPG